MVYVVKQLGKEKFIDYLEAFGFGVKQGIELDTEESGTIDRLLSAKRRMMLIVIRQPPHLGRELPQHRYKW